MKSPSIQTGIYEPVSSRLLVPVSDRQATPTGIQSLPPETLSHIFLFDFCRKSLPLHLWGISQAAGEVRSRMLVCKRWYAVIQQIHQLWDTLVFHCGFLKFDCGLDVKCDRGLEELERKKRTLLCYTSRSTDSPLHVGLYMEDDEMKGLQTMWEEIIRPALCRWATINIVFSETDAWSTLSMYTPNTFWSDLGSAARLTSLSITGVDPQRYDHGDPFSICLPNLLSLQIDRIRIPSVRMPSLRRLRISNWQSVLGDGFWEFLMAASQLESITFFRVGIRDWEDSWPIQIPESGPSLQNLKNVGVHECEPLDAHDLCLDILIIGNGCLESLKFDLEETILSQPIQPQTFLHLTLMDIRFTVECLGARGSNQVQLMEWLRQASSLKTLRASFSHVTHQKGISELFIQALLIHPNDRSKVICPRLTNLTLAFCYPVLPSLFLKVVAQRTALQEQLQSSCQIPGHSSPFMITL